MIKFEYTYETVDGFEFMVLTLTHPSGKSHSERVSIDPRDKTDPDMLLQRMEMVTRKLRVSRIF